MSISPVRLNHAVLFVADLDRSLRFYTDVFGMEVVAREPRANAAFLRLPRSGNHHDLGLFGVGTAGGPKRRGGHRPLPPGLAARHHRRARRRPPGAARRRRLHRRVQPRRHQERLRRRSRRQRVRADVDAAARRVGPVRERRPDRPPRPRRRGPALERRPHRRDRHARRRGGTAMTTFAPPVVAWTRQRRTTTARWSGCCPRPGSDETDIITLAGGVDHRATRSRQQPNSLGGAGTVSPVQLPVVNAERFPRRKGQTVTEQDVMVARPPDEGSEDGRAGTLAGGAVDRADAC